MSTKRKVSTVTLKRWGYVWPKQPPALLSYSMWRTRRQVVEAMHASKGVVRLTLTYEPSR